MIRHLDSMSAVLGGACALALVGAPMAVLAQAPHAAAGAGPSSTSSTAVGAATGPSRGPVGSATGGSAGSAAAGGTSASTLGIGGTSTSPTQSSTTLGVGGNAAAGQGGRAMSRSAVHGNNNLNGQAMAQAHQGGTFSKSHTHCKAGSTAGVACRTKTMAHVPGSRPSMSTTSSTAAPG